MCEKCVADARSMNRRQFLQAGALGSAAVVASQTVVAGFTEPASVILPALQPQATIAPPVIKLPPRQTWHRLGPPLRSNGDRLRARLSELVFLRVLDAFRGHSLQLVTADRLGREGLTHQYVNGVKISTDYLGSTPKVFDLEAFMTQTARWAPGQQLVFHQPGTIDLSTVLSGVTRVGMPSLPTGVWSSEHYIDETTGVCMRELSDYDITTDSMIVRWDLLLG